MTDERHTIAQVSKYYHPQVGGIEKVVKQLTEGHTDTFEHRVLAAHTRPLGTTEAVNGVDVRRVGSLGTLKSVPLTPTFPFHLRRAAREADLIHYHVPNPVAAVSHLAVVSDVPTVVTYHSDIVRQKRALELYEPALRRFLDDVDRIVTTSPRLLEHSPFLADYKEKCRVVPLAIDTSAVDDSVSGDRDGPFVLFVGRLNYYKGVKYLIDAALELDATIGIVGDGDQRAELESRADAHGVGDRVQFFGRVSDDELASLYQQADVFVLPSVEPSEAFAIVQLEAMARGIPVVNTNLPTGVPWVSRDGETGLTVPPRDAPALADAIQKLLDDDELRRRFGRNARERVETEFTEERMLARYRDVYRDVLRE